MLQCNPICSSIPKNAFTHNVITRISYPKPRIANYKHINIYNIYKYNYIVLYNILL